MQTTKTPVSGAPILTSDQQKELVLAYLRREWQRANKAVKALEAMGASPEGYNFNQRMLISELATLVSKVIPARIRIEARHEVTEFKYAILAVFSGLLDFRFGALSGNVLDLEYRVATGNHSKNDRIDCARRYGLLLGIEPRVSQLGHGADVTSLIIIRDVK